ncbi:uncharacterized protein [Ptychodera flava]|uniref:uncharacterized protein n=1 Tax=Ptychodera flava TaxID=63121 RepID=UPI003969D1F2
MDSILRELSLQTLTPRFQQQRITPRAVEALEDEDLIRLGVITIGDRINLRDLCREHKARGVNVSAGLSGVRRTSASSVSVERQLLFHCDRENRNRRRRYGGPTTTRRETSKKSRRSYTITCVCLADRCAEVVPRPAERHLLQSAGLGVRKVQFCTNDDENEVIAKIQGTFPKLKDSGGFEILQCTGNGRNLSVIKSNWSIEELKTRIGPQAKIYLRPIQKSLSTNSVTSTQTTNLTETCNGCKQIFPILELREHMLMCVDIVSSGDSDSELPPPPLAVATPEGEHEPGLLQTTSDSIVEDTHIRQVTSEMQEEEVTRNDSLEVQNVHYGQNESGHDKEAEETSVNSIAQHTVEYCQQNNISDPVEVLRYYQSKLQKGRKLDMTSLETCEEGETNYILVDRSHLLETSFDEIREIKDFRITLEVGFYDEKAADYGGPRKEFFRLALLKIKEKYFDAGLKMHLSEDYYLVGVIMGK